MARLQREWGYQARYPSEAALDLPWGRTHWAESREAAEHAVANPVPRWVQMRLVSRIVGDVEVVEP